MFSLEALFSLPDGQQCYGYQMYIGTLAQVLKIKKRKKSKEGMIPIDIVNNGFGYCTYYAPKNAGCATSKTYANPLAS
eukprot:4727812-Ditylum_brightwellii.AAC.1